MAKQVESEKGFLVIEMTDKEAKEIGFGISKGCLCMHCNNIIKNKMYYIAVLNDVMCKECYDEFIKTAHYYPEDSMIEKRNFDYIIALLK